MFTNVEFPYEIVKFISAGAEGQVSQIKNTNSGEIFAGKFLNEQLDESECQLLEKIKSRQFNHIIKILELKNCKGQDVIIMECGSQSLKQLIDNKIYQSYSNKYKNSLFLQILLGVREFHSLNYIHMDLKPENFICCQNNKQIQIKLIDFGLAKEIKYSKHSNQGKGSKFYMAPEVIKGLKYDKTADLWSLGVIWYQLLCGCLEIFEKSGELLQIQMDNNIQFNETIGDAEKIIIKKILLIKPEDRIQLKDLILEIRGLLSKQYQKINDKCDLAFQQDSESSQHKRQQLNRSGQFKIAADKCHNPLNMDNNNYQNYAWSGFKLHEQNNFQEAIQYYDKALNLNDQDDTTWNNKVQHYLQTKI